MRLRDHHIACFIIFRQLLFKSAVCLLNHALMEQCVFDHLFFERLQYCVHWAGGTRFHLWGKSAWENEVNTGGYLAMAWGF